MKDKRGALGIGFVLFLGIVYWALIHMGVLPRPF
jgi:hypothetical protein